MAIRNNLAVRACKCRYNQLKIIYLNKTEAFTRKKVNIPVTLQMGFTVRLRPIS